MPTAEQILVNEADETQQLQQLHDADAPPPPPHHNSPPRNDNAQAAAEDNDVALVNNSSMDDDGDGNDDDDISNDGSEDLLSSPSPSSSSPKTNDESNTTTNKDDDDDDDGIKVGRLGEKLDPNAGHCWACLVNLRATGASPVSSPTPANNNQCKFLYTTHEHPLLGIMVCSVCEERTEAVESDVIDIELDKHANANADATEMNACSWCGLADYEDELGEYEKDDGGIPSSDLLCCDKCPRNFCVRCVILSLGGDKSAWDAVREIVKSDEEWSCCKCHPTSYLEKLKGAYSKISSSSCSSPSPSDDNNNSAGEEENDSSPPSNSTKDDAYIQKLIDELDYAEYGLEEATKKLDYAQLDKERDNIGSILIGQVHTEDLEEAIERELDVYKRKWQLQFDRVSDTITRLQDELPDQDMAAYYSCREMEKEEEGDDDDPLLEEYMKEAEKELDKWDADHGYNKGEFRGASGYKPQDPRVLKLEPEDLNKACLDEIEDVNTTEGAIQQMQSNANSKEKDKNSWRSKTGTTDLDIEMFKKKAIKFEKINLGEMIDLDDLEKKCTTDKDDAAATKKEGSMVIRRKGSGGSRMVRVVRRGTTLRAIKKQVRKETTKSRLSRDNKQEYKPRLPPTNDTKMPATVPRAKKRAQLQRLSVNSSTSSGQLSPTMRGMLIGDDTAAFEDSDFVLDVAGLSSNVTVCQSLATLLKEHQREGLQFCWKNVCSQIMNYKQEGKDEIHGSILAHNMGLGKSFQAVCLLHTLLTHPLLTTSSAGIGGSGGRIIHRAMLLAPVNTLANWETEFEKWVGTSSGRRVSAIRFYPWGSDTRTVMKTVKEWYDYGGILCVSSEKYSNVCKKYLELSKSSKKKKSSSVKSDKEKTDAKKAARSEKDEAFLRKALFNPGPDIVVLDEVHTMLKSSSTNIYKVLCGLKTRLRLGLTGSPIQNNLDEYYRMASWVRPDCLGNEYSFKRKFHDPIMDGMAADCTPSQAEKQEQASLKLHGILEQFCHRRDAGVLSKDLPFLQETIIHVRNSMAQTKLYREFRKYQREMNSKNFFKQYHALRPVSNHPAVLIYPEGKNKSRPNTPLPLDDSKESEADSNSSRPQVAPEKFAWICDKCEIAKFRTLDEAEKHEEICDGTFDPALAPNAAPVDSVQSKPSRKEENEDWYKSFQLKAEQSDTDLKAIDLGGKVVLLLQIIAHCDAIGDKVVVFSQSLPTLSYIEDILNSPDWGGFKFHNPDDVTQQKIGGWKKDREYLRIDGSVDAKERGDLIDTFHSDTVQGNQAKLFLISTNAGGLGINLTAANRVVLFDSHWNPAVDLQAVYRCYRYGQTKPTYCYRLLAEGSMEQKIYSRAAAKTSLSDLVIDKANPERSFTRDEMNLLRVEDTWVGCSACGKWRMLPPGISSEEVDALPDTWYCKENVWDPPRSTCNAEERSALWMVKYYERRKREEDEDYVQSQGSLHGGSQPHGGSQSQPQSQGFQPTTSDGLDEKINEYTERDEVLQALISRSEEKKTASTPSNSASSASSGKMRWVSKWDFNFNDKTDKLDETKKGEEEEEEPPVKSPSKATKSPKKSKKSKQSAKKKSKSPTQSAKKKSQSPTQSAKKNGSKLTMYEQISPKRESARKKRAAAESELPADVKGSSSEKKKRKPESANKVALVKEAQAKVKAELEKAEKPESKAESKPEEPKPEEPKPESKPSPKNQEEKDDAVVDLTFDDSDSD